MRGHWSLKTNHPADTRTTSDTPAAANIRQRVNLDFGIKSRVINRISITKSPAAHQTRR